MIDKLSSACPGQVCGTLAGQAITPLLAAQGECTQQDMADSIIDAAQQFDDATKQNMIQLAIEYRQAEKNTPPDFTTNPPTNRNSVFCQKAPKNAELNGLVQAQDPANDPDAFFDPATKATVKKGSQANTFPFGQSGSSGNSSSSASASASSSAVTTSSAAAGNNAAAATTTSDASATASASDAATTGTDCVVTVTATVTATATDEASSSVATDSASSSASATTSASNAAASSTASAGAIGDFGKCTVPQIEFGVGFDNRKETSFQPVDKTSYNHGSAQGIQIITDFICDTLTNSCGADQTAKDTCRQAETAALAAPAKTGAQADAFNAVFGITTQFANVAEVDDKGQVVAGTGNGAAASGSTPSEVASATASVSASASSAAATSSAADATATASSAATSETATATSSSSAAAASSTSGSSSGIGNFGSCSVPQIEFGAGFDNRKETSFQPTDKASYAHDSAQNGDIITQFMCDNLVNKCGADDTAKATCAKAKIAFDSKTAKTGAQADAFNAVFGITTNFANVQPLDNQGKAVNL